MKANRKQTFVFVMPFFMNHLKNTYRYVYFGWCLGVLSCKKEEFDRSFDRLDRPIEESRPDR